MSVSSLAGRRYRIERRLGQGAMATVYLAHDQELGRRVAIKVLADNLAADDEFRARFVREARAAAGLAHPNVVSVFDAGEAEGRPYIVMEYVEGETVADALRRRRRFPADEAVRIALQACAGLEHAHAAGLVHRDVKPQNLLLQPDGTVKIADFGIVRAAETTRVTAVGTILGTAAYVAPEQAAGEDVAPAADVYSLGAVLYELLTGQPPYASQSLADLARKQAGEPITPVRDLAPEVPEALEAAVMRALARRPERRPPSAGELARDLADASGEAPTVALAEEAPTRAVRGRERRAARPPPLVAVALAAAALAAVLAGAFVFATSSGGDGATPVTPVEPVPRADTAEQQARNLAEWLRENARGTSQP